METSPVRDDTNKSKIITLSKIISKGAAGLIVPMGGAIFELIDQSIKWFRDKHFRESEERLYDFHKKLLECNESIGRDNLLDKEFCEDDYYSILKQVLNDEEKEKIGFYSSFFNSLLVGGVPKEFKNFLLKGISKLTVADMHLLKKIYLLNIALRLHPFVKKYCKNPLKSMDAVTLSGIQNLKGLGLITEKDNFFLLTRPSEILVLVLFDNDSILEGVDDATHPLQIVQFVLGSNNLAAHKKIIEVLVEASTHMSFSIVADISALQPSHFRKPIVLVVDVNVNDLIEKNKLYENEASIIIYYNVLHQTVNTHRYPVEFYINENEIDKSNLNEILNEMSLQRARHLEESRKCIVAEARAKLNELIIKDRDGITSSAC